MRAMMTHASRMVHRCARDADADADVEAEIDAAVDAPPDAPPDAYVAPYCDATDPALVACYPFDGDALDVSANDLDPQTANITFVAGRHGMAMQFGASSAAEVADSAALDVTALTVEAWIRPTPVGPVPVRRRQHALHGVRDRDADERGTTSRARATRRRRPSMSMA